MTYSVGLRILNEPDRENGLQELFAEASRAVELDPGDAKARVLKALAYIYGSPPSSEMAIKEASEAVELNPHDPQANSVLGVALALSSNSISEGIQWIEKAVQSSRRDPLHHLYLSQLAIARLCAGQYESAADTAQEAIRHKDEFIESHIALASAYGYLGKKADAKNAIAQFADVSREYIENHLVFSAEVKLKILKGLEWANQANS